MLAKFWNIGIYAAQEWTNLVATKEIGVGITIFMNEETTREEALDGFITILTVK